ncbi:MAG: TIGR02206 family membrane protein [Candidatus Marinimicrobia bacterium]|jgi:hypothetical integral membrane protein (TIGR02206 family)|nr:TIGR02206 family membrane protein [Candidatus Neomarinimicrobiota bacterium]|tara:strand:+ start:456 stop:1151 length:696 start_codon:yes stop_codon:yes gene_type:complete
MVQHEFIDLFGRLWWVTNLSTATIIFLFIFLVKKLKPDFQLKFGQICGVSLILRNIWINYYQIHLDLWTVESSLPLHLCGLSAILSGIVLVTRNQKLYELLFFWGIPGGYISIVTPEFTIGTQGWLFLDYYISHGGIIFSALYCTLIFRMKPSQGAWIRIFLWSQLFIPIVGVLNYYLDSNYMYINAPPEVENPFVVGEFPFHLIGFELAGLLHFWLLSLPFRKYYKKSES